MTINGIKVAAKPPIFYLEGWTITMVNYWDSSTTTIVLQWLFYYFQFSINVRKISRNCECLEKLSKTILYMQAIVWPFSELIRKLEIVLMNNVAVGSSWVTSSC